MTLKKQLTECEEKKELLARRLELAENKLKEIEAKKKVGFNCIVYCANCQQVGSVVVPKGVSIKESGCAWCGAHGFGYLVVKILNYA